MLLSQRRCHFSLHVTAIWSFLSRDISRMRCITVLRTLLHQIWLLSMIVLCKLGPRSPVISRHVMSNYHCQIWPGQTGVIEQPLDQMMLSSQASSAQNLWYSEHWDSWPTLNLLLDPKRQRWLTTRRLSVPSIASCCTCVKSALDQNERDEAIAVFVDDLRSMTDSLNIDLILHRSTESLADFLSQATLPT